MKRFALCGWAFGSLVAIGLLVVSLQDSGAEVTVTPEERAICQIAKWRYGRIIKSFRELVQPNDRGDVLYVELGVGSCQEDVAYRLAVKRHEFSCTTPPAKGTGTSRSCVVPLQLGENTVQLTVTEDAGAQYTATYSITVRSSNFPSPQKYVVEPAIGRFEPSRSEAPNLR